MAQILEIRYVRLSGLHDLKAKAKRWDDKELVNLQNKREKLENDLRDLHRQNRGDSELQQIDNFIRGLHNRMKYSEQELKELTFKYDQTSYEEDMQDKEAHLQEMKLEITRIEEQITINQTKSNDLDSRLHTVEDDVFSDFCKTINIPNIRTYEDKTGKESQIHQEKILDFDSQLSKLKNSLTFKKEEVNRQKKVVKNWASITKKSEATITDSEKEEENIQKSLSELEDSVADLSDQKQKGLLELKTMQAKNDESRKELSLLNKEVNDLQKRMGQKENEIEKEKSNRYNLLRHCQLENIKIPCLRGSLDNIIEAGTNATMNTTQDSIDDVNSKLDSTSLTENATSNVMSDTQNQTMVRVFYFGYIRF